MFFFWLLWVILRSDFHKPSKWWSTALLSCMFMWNLTKIETWTSLNNTNIAVQTLVHAHLHFLKWHPHWPLVQSLSMKTYSERFSLNCMFGLQYSFELQDIFFSSISLYARQPSVTLWLYKLRVRWKFKNTFHTTTRARNSPVFTLCQHFFSFLIFKVLWMK